tara:strand:- start:45812 stop:45979 length:168 start_codon:yes stop_codon:yes gene_type:complete
MNIFNVYLGKHLIMENVEEPDLKDKLVHLQEYFDWYPDDELRHEEFKVVPVTPSK